MDEQLIAEKLKELSIEVVESSFFWWLPGMMTLPFFDEYGDESYPGFRLDNECKWPWAQGEPDDAYPDLDDIATLGLIALYLLPKAWGDDWVISIVKETVTIWKWKENSAIIGHRSNNPILGINPANALIAAPIF